EPWGAHSTGKARGLSARGAASVLLSEAHQRQCEGEQPRADHAPEDAEGRGAADRAHEDRQRRRLDQLRAEKRTQHVLDDPARREPSTGMMRVTASSIAPPSRRKKNSMKSIMKKPTTVPMAPSATSPPMAAADRSSVCRPPVIQLSNCAALTQEFSRTHPTAP